jgi:acyl-CoA thioesterase FadM
MAYRIEDEAGHVVAEGSSVQVMYDYTAGHKVSIPEPIRKSIEELQRP